MGGHGDDGCGGWDSPWVLCDPLWIVVPRGSTITVSIDPAAVPEGYYLASEPVQALPVSEWPPFGPEWHLFFILNPLENTGEEVPQAEVPSDEPVFDDSGEAVTAETTGAQGVEDVCSLPNTGTQFVASRPPILV